MLLIRQSLTCHKANVIYHLILDFRRINLVWVFFVLSYDPYHGPESENGALEDISPDHLYLMCLE